MTAAPTVELLAVLAATVRTAHGTVTPTVQATLALALAVETLTRPATPRPAHPARPQEVHS